MPSDKKLIDLLPCPFCGKSNPGNFEHQGEHKVVRYVICKNCGATCSDLDTLPENNAYDAWNTRVNVIEKLDTVLRSDFDIVVQDRERAKKLILDIDQLLANCGMSPEDPARKLIAERTGSWYSFPAVSEKTETSFIDVTDFQQLESMTPVEGYDEIYKHYATTFGRTPDDFMSKVVSQTKQRLVIWWNTHGNTIREALVKYEVAKELELTTANSSTPTTLDTWDKTSAELTAITYEMDVIHERYNGKENRAEREELLKPLRLKCIKIGERRQALVTIKPAVVVCPIGIDPGSFQFCSAGYCDVCKASQTNSRTNKLTHE